MVALTDKRQPHYMTPPGQDDLDLVEFWLLNGENAIGYVSVFRNLPPDMEYAPGHIGVWVHPVYQSKGYGNLLCMKGIEEARKLGVSPIYLVTHEDNWPSRNMMRSCGATCQTHYKHALGDLVRYVID